MRLYGLDEAVRAFERPVFGTCAGMIVLDRDHLGLVDLDVDGATPSAARSRASRRTSSSPASDEPLRAVFIRAPWIEDAGPDVEVLAEVDGHPVLAREGRFLVVVVPPGADGRHARPRAVSGPCERTSRRRERGAVRCHGHSKWSSIKHKKGAADAKRGKLFSKLSRAIIVAAKEGGGDPGQQPRAAERDREGAARTRCRRTTSTARSRRARAPTPTRPPSRRSSTRATAPRASR